MNAEIIQEMQNWTVENFDSNDLLRQMGMEKPFWVDVPTGNRCPQATLILYAIACNTAQPLVDSGMLTQDQCRSVMEIANGVVNRWTEKLRRSNNERALIREVLNATPLA